MTDIEAQIVGLPVTIHEPDDLGEGRRKSTVFRIDMLLGQYEHEEKFYNLGLSGSQIVGYLPGGRAFSISLTDLVYACMDAGGFPDLAATPLSGSVVYLDVPGG